MYGNGKQFSLVEELTACILKEWKNLDKKYFKNPVEIMPERLAESLEKNGALANCYICE